MMRPGSGHAIALVVWLVVGAAIYYAIDSYRKPIVATIGSVAGATGEVVIPRSRDGHYYVEGTIGDHPVTFVIDTGASLVSVSERIARAAGLPKGAPAQFQTAGGDVLGEVVSGIAVGAAGIRIEGLSVAVGFDLGSANVALLGQNFLRRIEVTQHDDRMVLRVKRTRPD